MLGSFLQWLWNLFHKPKPVPLTLPYPQESANYSQTVDNVNAPSVIVLWLNSYRVPTEFWNYWQTKIEITIDPNYYYPAATWEENGIRHLTVRPEWLNAGVIAHEQSHSSFALLTDAEKQAFSLEYTPLKDTDPLIKLLYSTNYYGLTSDVEGHAELYRYLGDKMPQSLKRYYPKLF